ncbi:Protein kinase domain protein [Theileria parva strain Muguga]|uniref:Protein kinase domain protein n=1 Tax=Theileria parva strain Muguga TaxID=333668 RepID=UPI001C61EDCC|nr:Protein kinase domain protein [Theileria parva strain Muguga]EAN33824.2 Protein kinase domain protein [Theileria parva strain Muguga]
MSRFSALLIQRLSQSNIKVNENCTYWRPILLCLSNCENGLDTSPSKVESCFEGRALNQYFIQKRIAETSNSTLWRCFDIIENQFFCIKIYYITACRKERSVRFFRDDTEVITMLDKVIDEIIYHSSLQSCSGVSKVKEIIVDLEGDMIFFIMSYHHYQLMYYDYFSNTYRVPYSDNSGNKYLYKEEFAKLIMRQLVHTIQYFHENGVIHKDIKPDNLLLPDVDSTMFEPIGSPEENYSTSTFTDELVACDPSKFNIDEMFEQLGGLNCSEILTYRIDEIADVIPRDIVSHGFPYSYSDQFDFFYMMWDDCDTLVDLNYLKNRKGEFNVGKNSWLFASELSKKSQLHSRNLLNYFIEEPTNLNYKINRNFICNEIENSSKVPLHSDQEKNIVIVSDFGVASLAEEESGNLVIFDSEGTTSFTSPESLRYVEGSIPASERDVFALGVTLYCMIYGKLPYFGNNGIEMLINILETTLVFHSFREVSQDLKLLLSHMLHKEHDKRIKLKDILSHPWLNS